MATNTPRPTLGNPQNPLAKWLKNGYDIRLSQNTLAVMPHRPNWLFYCPKGSNPPSHTGKTRLPLMGWLILQNKPLGEYVERLLTLPRVRPTHLLQVITQKQTLGVTKMVIKSPQLAPYGWATLQNKPLANMQGGYCVTESEPNHLLQVITQKYTGAYQC